MEAHPAHAMIRFGLGPRPQEAAPGDAQAWLLGQLDGPDPAKFAATLPSTADGLTILREQNKLQLEGVSMVGALLRQDIRVQQAEWLTTAAPFRERLAWFWTNHFTVSLRQGGTSAIMGAYIREAIRPNVTGSFFAMLLSVMRHPAMLMYLENSGSVGPHSVAGQRSRTGLNENLARECMELHTLSPASGFTQADVTAFANLLTGWSVEMNALQPGYVFRPDAHEPGSKTLMGQTFPPGEAGGLLALAFLAAHPATHRHLATKLVRHFVNDDPPPDAVRTVEGVLRDTNGDLAAAARAVVLLPAAWTPLTKFRSPLDYTVAALRLIDLPEDRQPSLPDALNVLGQPLWNAPLPNGWSDSANDWTAPEALLRRVDWAYGMAGRVRDFDPSAMADTALGPLLRPETRDQIHHAGSRRDGLTLLLTSPEFQRR